MDIPRRNKLWKLRGFHQEFPFLLPGNGLQGLLRVQPCLGKVPEQDGVDVPQPGHEGGAGQELLVVGPWLGRATVPRAGSWELP